MKERFYSRCRNLVRYAFTLLYVDDAFANKPDAFSVSKSSFREKGMNSETFTAIYRV